jgi:hypothetical protein
MCLNTVSRICNPEPKEIVGYKYFDMNGSDIRSPMMGSDNLYKLGKWIDDASESLIDSDEENQVLTGVKADGTLKFNYNNKQYPSGFHILRTKKDARKYVAASELGDWRLFKVKYKNVVAEGLDNGARVVIARSMLILERTER